MLKYYVGVCQSLLKSDTFLQGICTILKLFTWCFLLTNSQTTIWTGNNSTMQKMYLSLGELGFERPCKINWSCDRGWTFHNIENWSQTWSLTIVSRNNGGYSSVPGSGGHKPEKMDRHSFLAQRERGRDAASSILNMTKCHGNYVVTPHWFLGRSLVLTRSPRELFKGFRHNISRLIYNNTANWSQKMTFITTMSKKV